MVVDVVVLVVVVVVVVVDVVVVLVVVLVDVVEVEVVVVVDVVVVLVLVAVVVVFVVNKLIAGDVSNKSNNPKHAHANIFIRLLLHSYYTGTTFRHAQLNRPQPKLIGFVFDTAVPTGGARVFVEDPKKSI